MTMVELASTLAFSVILCAPNSIGFSPLARPAIGSALNADRDKMEELSRVAGGAQSARWIEAASSVTRDSCSLLGVKCIGVDYGLVRTGIAVSVGYSPQPLAILADLNSTELSNEVIRISSSEQAARIIVGLPLHKNGTEANQTGITRAFASELAGHVLKRLGPDVGVYMWDERYTSKAAAARVHTRNPDQELYGILDAEAACIILENYYHDSGKDAELVQVEDPDTRASCLESWKRHKQAEKIRLEESRNSLNERLRWRKEAMERDRITEQENGQSTFDGKKKKRKKKKRR